MLSYISLVAFRSFGALVTATHEKKAFIIKDIYIFFGLSAQLHLAKRKIAVDKLRQNLDKSCFAT